MTGDSGRAQSDASLADRIVAGDTSAEHQLIVEFGSRVYALSMARTGNPDTARDLVQDVLLAVIQALRAGQLKDSAKLSAFILGTARNVVKNYLRKAKPQQLDAEEIHAPNSSWPDWQLAELERRTLVRQALSVLSQIDQQILMLTLVQGLKPGEIALRLGLSNEVVRQRKLRAMRKIREEIHGSSQKTRSNHSEDKARQ